jgi:hypothetical protein
MNATYADCFENKTREGLRRGGARQELKKRGRGMKGRVKIYGRVTLIPESIYLKPNNKSRRPREGDFTLEL